MTIDLIEQYGTRVIDGIAVEDIINHGEAMTHGISVPAAGGRITLYLDCIRNIFSPSKSYYKMNEASDCSFCRRAMGYEGTIDCLECFKFCINHREIKKQKLIIKAPL